MVKQTPLHVRWSRRSVFLLAVMYSGLTSFWVPLSVVLFMRGYSDFAAIEGAVSLLWLCLAVVHWRWIRRGDHAEGVGATVGESH